eukprot:355664-Chlamydomonas_euryale.AAC.9
MAGLQYIARLEALVLSSCCQPDLQSRYATSCAQRAGTSGRAHTQPSGCAHCCCPSTALSTGSGKVSGR